MLTTIVFLTTLAIAAAITVTVPGSPVTSIETTSTVLECTFTTTSSNPLISWYKGSSTSTGYLIIQKDNSGVFPQPGITRHDIQNQASLLITDTQLSDADKYWCQVEGLGDPRDEKSITLTVTPATPPSQPTISITAGSNPSNAGNIIRLKCTSTGSPTPSCSWLRDNQPLPAITRYQLSSDGSAFTINPSDKDDNGKTFTCHVTNVKGNKDEHIILNIRYAPDNPDCTYQTTTSLSYLLDDEMKIRCQSTDGNPLATLHWYHGNNQIQGLSSSTNGNTVSQDYTWNLNRNDNGEMYRCEATNVIQITPLPCQLGPFNVYFPAESVTLSGITNPVKEGETKILTCTTSTSNPASQISWLKDNNVWTANTYESITSDVTRDGDYNGEISEQQMTISIQAEHNNKSYQCQLSHTDITGHVTSTVIHLTVYYKPFVVNVPHNQRSYASKGSVAELRCEIESNPLSSVIWYGPNNQPINNDSRVSIKTVSRGTLHESILTIQNTMLSDYGSYSCFAENDIGSTTFIVTFNDKILSQSFRGVPIDTVVLEGNEVMLNCSWKDFESTATVAWNRVQLSLYLGNKAGKLYADPEFDDCCEIVGNTQNNDFTLKIRNANFDDMAIWKCSYSGTILLEEEAKITVLAHESTGVFL
ncbi:peroxidasin homolog [Saccoglossus kowalevskii]